MTFWTIALAVAYLTYVLAKSEFPPVEAVRVKVFDKWGEGSTPAYLATCVWCVSFYTSALVVWMTEWLSDLKNPVIIWLGAAFASGAINTVFGLVDKIVTLVDKHIKWMDQELRR